MIAFSMGEHIDGFTPPMKSHASSKQRKNPSMSKVAASNGHVSRLDQLAKERERDSLGASLSPRSTTVSATSSNKGGPNLHLSPSPSDPMHFFLKKRVSYPETEETTGPRRHSAGKSSKAAAIESDVPLVHIHLRDTLASPNTVAPSSNKFTPEAQEDVMRAGNQRPSSPFTRWQNAVALQKEKKRTGNKTESPSLSPSPARSRSNTEQLRGPRSPLTQSESQFGEKKSPAEDHKIGGDIKSSPVSSASANSVAAKADGKMLWKKAVHHITLQQSLTTTKPQGTQTPPETEGNSKPKLSPMSIDLSALLVEDRAEMDSKKLASPERRRISSGSGLSSSSPRLQVDSSKTRPNSSRVERRNYPRAIAGSPGRVILVERTSGVSPRHSAAVSSVPRKQPETARNRYYDDDVGPVNYVGMLRSEVGKGLKQQWY